MQLPLLMLMLLPLPLPPPTSSPPFAVLAHSTFRHLFFTILYKVIVQIAFFRLLSVFDNNFFGFDSGLVCSKLSVFIWNEIKARLLLTQRLSSKSRFWCYWSDSLFIITLDVWELSDGITSTGYQFMILAPTSIHTHEWMVSLFVDCTNQNSRNILIDLTYAIGVESEFMKRLKIKALIH